VTRGSHRANVSVNSSMAANASSRLPGIRAPYLSDFQEAPKSHDIGERRSEGHIPFMTLRLTYFGIRVGEAELIFYLPIVRPHVCITRMLLRYTSVVNVISCRLCPFARLRLLTA